MKKSQASEINRGSFSFHRDLGVKLISGSLASCHTWPHGNLDIIPPLTLSSHVNKWRNRVAGFFPSSLNPHIHEVSHIYDISFCMYHVWGIRRRIGQTMSLLHGALLWQAGGGRGTRKYKHVIRIISNRDKLSGEHKTAMEMIRARGRPHNYFKLSSRGGFLQRAAGRGSQEPNPGGEPTAHEAGRSLMRMRKRRKPGSRGSKTDGEGGPLRRRRPN